MPQPVLLYCDFHGHSRRSDVFTFGCYELSHDGAPFVPGDFPGEPAPTNPGSRLFPRLLSARVDTFTYKGCGWKVAKEKLNCARVAMWRDAGLTASYTIEATFGGASAGFRSGVHLNTSHYEEVGHAFCLALHDWLDGPQGARLNGSLEALRRIAYAQTLTSAARKRAAPPAAAAGTGAGGAAGASTPSGSAAAGASTGGGASSASSAPSSSSAGTGTGSGRHSSSAGGGGGDTVIIDYGGGRSSTLAVPPPGASDDGSRPKTVGPPPRLAARLARNREGTGTRKT